LIFVVAVCLLPVAASAQVVVHQAALDQLAGIAPPTPAPAVHKIVRRRVHHRPLLRVVAKPAPVAAAKPAVAAVKPAVAVAAAKPAMPALPALPPPAPMDAQQIQQVLAAQEAADAAAADKRYALLSSKPAVPTAVAKPAPAPKTAPGLPAIVVTFVPGGDDLQASAAAALQPVCKHAGAAGLVAIDAYAPADASDPSAAMRLSLSRAFAVRDALTGCGIPAAHIIPRADGAAGGDTGIARVSVTGGVENK
jgi:outer membrane protein OmpA-like peptidoglycan-associated protein